MSTPVSLHYRCQLPGGTKAGLPVFNDLRSVRTGPLSERVGLGRLLTVPRLLDAPVVVVVADEADLANPLDQQAVASLLRATKSELVVAGKAVAADTAKCTVLDELELVASNGARFVHPDPSDDPGGRKDDVRACIQALVTGLDLRPPQVAKLLNAVPGWRVRSASNKGFTRQSVGYYARPVVSSCAKRTEVERSGPRRPVGARPWDLTEVGEGRALLTVAGSGFNVYNLALSISVSNRDALTGAQRVVLEEIVRRSGGELTGVASAEPTAEQRDQLDRVIPFVLDVVQGEFLDRPHPARNLDRARLYALSRNRKQLKAVASELDRAGYLTTSTYGQWSTGSVSALLGPGR